VEVEAEVEVVAVTSGCENENPLLKTRSESADKARTSRALAAAAEARVTASVRQMVVAICGCSRGCAIWRWGQFACMCAAGNKGDVLQRGRNASAQLVCLQRGWAPVLPALVSRI
jgi:sulfite reductase beta subunit-like hemoprotein